jgi:AbrB family looped-hinge helix DNA binding protein
MDVTATVSSKGQLTLPKSVREALGIETGDQVVFRVSADRAVLARSPSLLDLAGSVPVPALVRGASWDEVRARSRRRARSE